MNSGIESLLRSERYRSLRLQLQTIGPYTPRDSEWNYSDVPHLNVVHTRVSGHTLLCSRTLSSSLFLQRIGPWLVPATLHIEHEDPSVHHYLLTILNLVVCVSTTHAAHAKGCLTTTTYNFHYRGPLGWFMAHLARWATRRNYRVLMAEDRPMREQRQHLRHRGVRFAFDDADLIGFSDTLDIQREHVDASGLQRQSDHCILNLADPQGCIPVSDLLLQVSWDGRDISLWPLICPHEGAPLQAPNGCGAAQSLACPWHGRRLRPLLVLPRSVPADRRLNVCGQAIQVQLLPGHPQTLDELRLAVISPGA
jgi:hypothetical protein